MEEQPSIAPAAVRGLQSQQQCSFRRSIEAGPKVCLGVNRGRSGMEDAANDFRIAQRSKDTARRLIRTPAQGHLFGLSLPGTAVEYDPSGRGIGRSSTQGTRSQILGGMPSSMPGAFAGHVRKEEKMWANWLCCPVIVAVPDLWTPEALRQFDNPAIGALAASTGQESHGSTERKPLGCTTITADANCTLIAHQHRGCDIGFVASAIS
ncbi:hypothetical protein NKI82_25935 [Mesorhizobium sp. M0482]|uniref:hypothetical protein n=1 Tax=Mesorhizobium sp. M0482 TaxID=2956948 RepID=UPI003339220D